MAETERPGIPSTADLAAEAPPPKADTTPTHDDVMSRPMTAAEIRLLLELAPQIQIRFPDGMPTFTQPRTYHLAAKMLDAYPADWSIPEIGPAYDTASLARFWAVSERTVRRRVAAGRLFAITVAHGRYLYPSFEFDADMFVLPGLLDLVTAIRPAIPDARDIAVWLATRPTQASPADLLFQGNVADAFDRARHVVEHTDNPIQKQGT